MEIVVTGRHTQVKQKFRDVVESKMNRVTAIAPDAQRAQIVLTHEGNPRQADTAKRVEITVIAGSTVVRAEASSTDEFSALDMALDKLTLRLRRTRDRRKDHRRGYINPTPVDLGAVAPPEPEEEPEPEEPNNSPEAAVASDLGPGESVEVQVGDTPIVIRRKLHIAEPMSIDEALYEMVTTSSCSSTRRPAARPSFTTATVGATACSRSTPRRTSRTSKCSAT